MPVTATTAAAIAVSLSCLNILDFSLSCFERLQIIPLDELTQKLTKWSSLVVKGLKV
jgi:hypothetical protein